MHFFRTFLLLASSVFSVNASAETKIFTFSAEAKVDATGTVVSADVLDETVAHEFETAIVRLMKQWRFQPPVHNGKNVSVSTDIEVEVSVAIAADKSAAITARYVNHGPGEIRDYRRNVPPIFPPLARRHPRDALVALVVQIDAEGIPMRIEPFSIHIRGGKPTHSKTYLKSAIDAVNQWRFRPESIEGIAITGSLLVPIRYAGENQHEAWELLLAPTTEFISRFGPADPNLGRKLPRVSSIELRMIDPTNASEQR